MAAKPGELLDYEAHERARIIRGALSRMVEIAPAASKNHVFELADWVFDEQLLALFPNQSVQSPDTSTAHRASAPAPVARAQCRTLRGLVLKAIRAARRLGSPKPSA